MKGLVILGDSKAEVRELPDPEVSPGLVRVKVKSSGICGSDVHIYHRPASELGDRLGKVMGHEPSGVVEAIGDCVTTVKPGDRVSVFHYVGCGHCRYCRTGYRQHCPERSGIEPYGYGSAAEYVLVPEANCLPLPDELSFVDGAMMACCAGTAFSALAKLDASGADDMAIFGLGPVGLSALVEAKAMGARVLGVEIIPERLELAKKLGADAVIDASEADPVEAIRDLTHGRGVDLAVETTGADGPRVQIIEALDVGGKAVYVGLGSRKPVISPPMFLGTEKTLMGSFVLPMSKYDALAQFLVERKVDLEGIATHRFPIERGVEALEFFDAGRCGKVMLAYD